MNEIREKNSMAYTAYGFASSRGLPGAQTYFSGYIGPKMTRLLTLLIYI